MPTFATDHDSTTQHTIEKWKIAAREEVEMIGAWRDADADKLADYWTDGYTFRGGGPPKMPNMFYTNTTCLVGEIVARYPKLDPAPLQDVYAAIAAWYADHSAARIPPQPVLFATLERAMMTLQAIEYDIQSRVVYENQGKVNSRGLESAPINYQLCQSGQDGIALPELPAAPAEADGKADARKRKGQQAVAKQEMERLDLISSEVAVREFCVSRSTLKRAVARGKLRDYRPKNSPANAAYRLSRAEVAGQWPARI